MWGFIIIVVFLLVWLLWYILAPCKIPYDWEAGDIIEYDGDEYIIKYFHPDRKTMIVRTNWEIPQNDTILKCTRATRNLSLKKKIESNKFNRIKEEAKDYTEQLNKLK